MLLLPIITITKTTAMAAIAAITGVSGLAAYNSARSSYSSSYHSGSSDGRSTETTIYENKLNEQKEAFEKSLSEIELSSAEKEQLIKTLKSHLS